MMANIEATELTPETSLSGGVAGAAEDESVLLDYQALSSKDHWLLEKWYYAAILNLATAPGFKSEPAWIAKRLGLAESNARDALAILFLRQALAKLDSAEKACRILLKFADEKLFLKY